MHSSATINPVLLVESLYLGDRACKKIVIDSWKKEVRIQVDLISRLKPGAKTWDFSSEGDIKDGWIVFTAARFLSFDPSGPIPNDFINELSVKPTSDDAIFEFQLSIGSVNKKGASKEILLKIEAAGIHLESHSEHACGNQ